MILRALSGLVVGLIYAALAGAFTYVFWRLTNDPTHPGPMIPDNNAWGRILVFFVTLTAAILGGLVGVVVSLTQFNKTRGALIGGIIGMALFLILASDFVKNIPTTRRYWTELFQALGMYFVLLPLGLTLTGLAAALVQKKLRL
jgi:hypothetical protein